MASKGNNGVNQTYRDAVSQSPQSTPDVGVFPPQGFVPPTTTNVNSNGIS